MQTETDRAVANRIVGIVGDDSGEAAKGHVEGVVMEQRYAE